MPPTTRSGGAGEEKGGDSINLDTEAVLGWHKVHPHVKKVRLTLSSNAAGVSKDQKVYVIEVLLRARITSTAVIVALPTSSTTKMTTIGIFEEDGSCPDDHTEHSLSAREIELIFKSEEDLGHHYPEGYVASNQDGSPSSALIRTFKLARLSLLESFSRYRQHGGEECELGAPVLNDARAKLLATKDTSFTQEKFLEFAKEQGAVLGTKALSASYMEVIFAFFNKHFGEFYTAEQLMGKGSQSLLPYSSSHSEEQEVVAPEGESDDEDCTPFLKVNNKGMSGTFDMGSKDFGTRFLRKGDLEPPDLSFSSVAANSAGLSIQSQGRVACLFARALQAYEEGKMVVDAKQMQEILLLDRLSGYLRALVHWTAEDHRKTCQFISAFLVENKSMLQQATSIQLSICLNPVVLFVALGKKNWTPVLEQGQLSFRQLVFMFATNGNNLRPTTIPTVISLFSHALVIDGKKIEHPLSLIARLCLAVESSRPLITNPGINMLDSRVICAVAINAICEAAEKFLPEDKEYWLRIMSEHDAVNGTVAPWSLEKLTERLQRDKAERFVGDNYEYFDSQSDVPGVKAQQQRFAAAARGETSSAIGGSSSSGPKSDGSKKRGQRSKNNSSNGSSSDDGAGTVTLPSGDKISLKELQKFGKQIIAALHISGMAPGEIQKVLNAYCKKSLEDTDEDKLPPSGIYWVPKSTNGGKFLLKDNEFGAARRAWKGFGAAWSNVRFAARQFANNSLLVSVTPAASKKLFSKLPKHQFFLKEETVTEMKACFARVPEDPEDASESSTAVSEMSRGEKIEALADQMLALQREQQAADQEASARDALARQQVSAAALRQQQQQQQQQQQPYAFGAVPVFPPGMNPMGYIPPPPQFGPQHQQMWNPHQQQQLHMQQQQQQQHFQMQQQQQHMMHSSSGQNSAANSTPTSSGESSSEDDGNGSSMQQQNSSFTYN